MGYIRIASLSIVVLFTIMSCGSKPDPIKFNGISYMHVETTEYNKVVNYFFTPGGGSPDESDQHLQIVDVTSDRLKEPHLNMVRRQIAATMNLKPLKSKPKHYFGMFRGRHPIYAVESSQKFLIYSVNRGFVGNESQLRRNSDEIFSKMDALVEQLSLEGV